MIGMDTNALLPQALLGAVQSRLSINSPTDDTYCDLFYVKWLMLKCLFYLY